MVKASTFFSSFVRALLRLIVRSTQCPVADSSVAGLRRYRRSSFMNAASKRNVFLPARQSPIVDSMTPAPVHLHLRRPPYLRSGIDAASYLASTRRDRMGP
ncbi:protein of unknown function [Pararobbsia alpina]